jgi:hypothetical protein
MRRALVSTIFCAGLALAGPACAWGELGHRVTALIAYRHLTPAAKARVDALLASDTDTLTAPDIGSRAAWADKYRNGHRETAAWHFVDVEIDHPDLDAACFGFPAPPLGLPASQGPAQDCVVHKIEEFYGELQDPATPPAERLLAFKFLLHFVGDLQQPLHAADHDDHGGNCVGLSPSPDGHSSNLHAYWDTGVVEALGHTPEEIAAKLDRGTTSDQAAEWARGDARSWARQSFQIARTDVYALPVRPTCSDHATTTLSPAYQARAQQIAAVQLEKAGLRIAALLNRALAS